MSGFPNREQFWFWAYFLLNGVSHRSLSRFYTENWLPCIASDILFTVVQFTVPKKIYSLQFAVYSFKITTYSFVRVSQNINLKVKKVMLMPFVSSESAKRNCFNNNIVQEKAQFCWLKFITFRRPDYQNSLCTLNWNMVIKQVWGPSEKVHWLKTA